jgi:hypothetical protein
MSGFEGPLDIPLLGSLVAQAVESFAREHDLRFDLWHQNAPIWVVWKEIKPDDYIREVQVAAFRTRDGEALFFIPHAYQFDGERLKSTPATPTNIIQRPLQIFSLAQEDVESTRQKIQELLEQAWSGAEVFRKSELTEQL